MDFYKIIERNGKNKSLEIFPEFKVCRSKDLMIRGKSFYAIWDDSKGLWSKDEYDIQILVDKDLKNRSDERSKTHDGHIDVKYVMNFSNNVYKSYRMFVRELTDNGKDLDAKITFSNTTVTRDDYVSKRLHYPLEEGTISNYDEIMNTLFDDEERDKLEWAIGSIISGDSKYIQKFMVLYGQSGTGKSTFLNIVQELFKGYYITFEAKSLTNNSNFATEMFCDNPLIAIQHDGDLSKIEDNTLLNSIISHEEILIKEKYKPARSSRANAFLFMGTNNPVKISDSKSGIIRRLIDVSPSGRKLPSSKYNSLTKKIKFELGAIAYHCLEKYKTMGKDYYANYKPLSMLYETDTFFNFVEEHYEVFKKEEYISLARAYDLYKGYCDESNIQYKLVKYKFREELKSYFTDFDDRKRTEYGQLRSIYSGFITSKFESSLEQEKNPVIDSLVLDCKESLIDTLLATCPAQYATEEETPKNKWEKVKTKLSDINTSKIHYIIPPINHIVIDFDLKDNMGNKSMELNLREASKWPKTYAEFSKGGGGVHLHYNYVGDVSRLSRVFSEDIEIKVFNGNASLRRRLSLCNEIPVADISSGLPLKGDSKMLNFDAVQSEKGLRDLVMRNLHKEIHAGTKPSMDFIKKILDDAFNNGMKYDIRDMRTKILSFAMSSSNQADYCLKLIDKMKFQSEEASENVSWKTEGDLVFFDVEVFPNLCVVCFKVAGKDKKVIKLINPTPSQIEEILKFKLVGFNCRRYDNHILYAIYIGYTNEQLYNLSKKIIENSPNVLFGEAYNISYTDVYDFASAGNKKGLKKWQLELGIHHQENHRSWDEPVPEEAWDEIANYCCNDVISTEIVFEHLAGDWAGRQILSMLSGKSVNDTTNANSIALIFGKDSIKTIKPKLEYTNLGIMFPGYKFERGVSTYRGIEVGEGGYVEAIPGMYSDVAVMDVASMHPTSIELLNLLGPYTKKYSELKQARLALKHQNRGALEILLDGLILQYYDQAMEQNPRFTLKDISNAVKTALNAAYGLTSASFDNAFKDPRNIDNIVAKRGALFMIDLKYAVEELGYDTIHIKTDSIKLVVPESDQSIVEFIFKFGKKYGYDFEHEETYSRFCLVNNAVYIARVKGWESSKSKELIDAKGWTATGSQFAHPYVFKTLFSKQKINSEDLIEIKSVTAGGLYLDMNEDLPEGEHIYSFVGRVGAFYPMKPGCGGGILYRFKDDKYYAATGTKGYRWMETVVVRTLGKEADIDMSYYERLANEAYGDISKLGNFDWFISDSEETIYGNGIPIGIDDVPPWIPDCPDKTDCHNCSNWIAKRNEPNTCKLGYECMPF